MYKQGVEIWINGYAYQGKTRVLVFQWQAVLELYCKMVSK
jgi:hypothetical protein